MKLDRRTFLRGAGVAIALPYLDAMTPAFASVAAPPVRLGFIFVPNGSNMSQWSPNPKIKGLPPTLLPLTKVAAKVNILTGLDQKNGDALGDGAGDHARDSAAYLTGAHPVKTAGKEIKVGVSADQFAAQQVGKLTRLPSLEIGTEGSAQSGNCDSGYSCAYSSNISWRTPSSPMAKETSPRNLFIRLFGDPDAAADEAEKAREATYLKSMLDLALDDVKKLKAKLGAADSGKLEEYLDAVREIESQIQAVEKTPKGPPKDLAIPKGPAPKDFEQHLHIMSDLLVAAFQTDTTRIATFMFANSGANHTYPMLGINEGHHTISHHAGDKSKLDQLAKIDEFHVKQFAYLLEKMDGVKEEKGTLLDNVMIVYGGAISDPNAHNHHDLPILLAGKGGNTIQSGRVIKNGAAPLCNLFLSLFDRMKVKAETFGDSTKRLVL